jgi:hypothetical protein
MGVVASVAKPRMATGRAAILREKNIVPKTALFYYNG